MTRQIIICTSRPESMRRTTAQWLTENMPELFAVADLHMRLTDEIAADFDVARRDKAGMIAKLADGRPCCIIDDDIHIAPFLREAQVLVDGFVVSPDGWPMLATALDGAPDDLVIVIDVDGTLCQSPPVVDGDLVAWREAVCMSDPPPVTQAVVAIAELLGRAK